MKKIIALILSVVFMMSLMACGTQQANEDVAKTDEGTKVKTEKGESKKETKDEEVTLRIACTDPSNEGLDIAEEIFKGDHPNVNIEYITSPWGSGGQELRYKELILISSGQEPDIGQMVWGKEFFREGVIEDITAEVQTWDIYGQLTPGQLDRMSLDGKIYGVTYNNNCVFQFANMDILNQVGYTEPPTTMDELIDIAKKIEEGKLTTEDGKPIYTVSFEGGNWSTDWWLWANGGQQMNEDYTKTLIDSPESIEAYQLMQDFVESGWAPKIDGTYDQLWLNGQIAIWTCGDWDLAATIDAGINAQYAPLPKGKGGNDTSIGGVEWAVFKSSNNKKVALEFLETLYTEELQTTFSRGITDVRMYDNPVNHAKWQEEGILDAKLVQKEQLNSTKYNFLEAPFIYPEASKVYNEALEKILVGLQDVEVVMKEAATQINEGIAADLK